MQEAGKFNVIAVINPNSGPDFTGGDATVKCLPHLKRAGNTLIGYVATGDMCAHAHRAPRAQTRLSSVGGARPTETKQGKKAQSLSVCRAPAPQATASARSQISAGI